MFSILRHCKSCSSSILMFLFLLLLLFLLSIIAHANLRFLFWRVFLYLQESSHNSIITLSGQLYMLVPPAVFFDGFVLFIYHLAIEINQNANFPLFLIGAQTRCMSCLTNGIQCKWCMDSSSCVPQAQQSCNSFYTNPKYCPNRKK